MHSEDYSHSMLKLHNTICTQSDSLDQASPVVADQYKPKPQLPDGTRVEYCQLELVGRACIAANRHRKR